MDQFKFSLGPFELFSAIISGIPLLIAVYLAFNSNLTAESDPLHFFGDVNFTTVFTLGVLCYVGGVVMSGFSFKYFKLLCRIARKNYQRTEQKMLREVGKIDIQKPEHVSPSNPFEERLAYLVKKQIGDSPISRSCSRLLPYLRQHAPHLSAHVDQFMAKKIMLRNLSLGFFLLGLVILIKTLIFDLSLVALYVTAGIFFLVAWFSFARAVTFRDWWAREILLSFYHQALEKEDG